MTKEILKIDELAVLARMLRGKRSQIAELSGMSEETVNNFFCGRSNNIRVLEAVETLIEELKSQPKNESIQNLKKNIAEFTG